MNKLVIDEKDLDHLISMSGCPPLKGGDCPMLLGIDLTCQECKANWKKEHAIPLTTAEKDAGRDDTKVVLLERLKRALDPSHEGICPYKDLGIEQQCDEADNDCESCLLVFLSEIGD